MTLRFFFLRAAAGTLAVGSAAPVNLPYEMQALENAMFANAVVPVRPVDAYSPTAPQRGDAQIADADDLHGEKRLLKISKQGDLPCDSSEWANSPLFGPHAGLAAALGVKGDGTAGTGRDTALADALTDRPATGDADSSAFGSVFGNAPQPSMPGLGGGLFGGTDTGGTGGTVGGGGTKGGGTGTGTGGTGGTGTGGTGTGGTGTGGTGTGGTGGTGTGGTGTGGTGTGGTGTGGTGGTGAGGGTGGAGTGGGTIPPIDPGNPSNPGSGGHDGGGDGGSHTTVPGAVPEPASWATMLVGFGFIGGMMRRRRPVAALNR